MSFTLGRFFPKKPFNEPMLQLDDTCWAELEGGYRGNTYNASHALKQLEQAENVGATKTIYDEFWNELHHQGDVGPASYYAVPHIIRIAKQKQFIDYNALNLVTVIEIQRHKNNPPLSPALTPAYQNALTELGELALRALKQNQNLETATSVLAAIAISKGQFKLADVISNMTSEDELDQVLENY